MWITFSQSQDEPTNQCPLRRKRRELPITDGRCQVQVLNLIHSLNAVKLQSYNIIPDLSHMPGFWTDNVDENIFLGTSVTSHDSTSLCPCTVSSCCQVLCVHCVAEPWTPLRRCYRRNKQRWPHCCWTPRLKADTGSEPEGQIVPGHVILSPEM